MSENGSKENYYDYILSLFLKIHVSSQHQRLSFLSTTTDSVQNPWSCLLMSDNQKLSFNVLLYGNETGVSHIKRAYYITECFQEQDVEGIWV